MLTRLILGSVLIAGLVGCGAAQSGEGPKPATAGVEAGAEPAAEKKPEQAPSAAAPASATPAAAAATPAATPAAEAKPAESVIALADLAESPGDPELEKGAEALRKKDFIKAQKLFGAALEKLGPSAPPSSILVGRALLGRSYSAANTIPAAKAEYQKALDLWNDAKTIERLNNDGRDEAAKRDQKGRALLAAAEALSFFADQKRAEVDKLRMPQYKGDNTKDAVSNFIKTDVANFIKSKQAALDDVDKSYQAVIDLKPTAPQWVTRAHARMAMMRGKLAAELRAAPVPGAWKSRSKLPGSTMSGDEIRGFYYSLLDEAAKPLLAQAQSTFEECKQQAARFNRDDEFTRSCSTWLEKRASVAQP